MSQHLNIVAFDVPYPANYGGVIDVYYKLYWLKKAGVKVHLHCFTYGRGPAKELEALCETVSYYERKTGICSNLSLLPYNVKSRQSKDLAENLLKNEYPILFEVLHTCELMANPAFKQRVKIYRHSNIEHDYYSGLAMAEKDLLKKIYLRVEALKLKAFEKIIAHADLILAVNQKDQQYFQTQYPKVKSVFLPSFHQDEDFAIHTQTKDYLLFHGNLSVSENHNAALWLIEQVFGKISERVIIAGLKPSETLIESVQKYKHIQLIKSPDAAEMEQLIRGARLHVLCTAQSTGLKLKLLNVLFKGNFVLCNPPMLEGTTLKANRSLCLATNAEEYLRQIPLLMKSEFTEEMKTERRVALQYFKNKSNIQKLLKLVFELKLSKSNSNTND